MPPILRNLIALVLGVLSSGTANMSLIKLGGKLLPPPPGVDVNDIASINAHIGEYTVAQLMMPFLAHALGTLLGAFLAARIAASRQLFLALIVGALGLLGGAMAVHMIPNSPLWFDILDLGFAYIPMALLGWLLAGGKR